ncbi:hypothetical protein GNY88_03215 [Borrelia miyamotoi]|uniref:hypothetical protein n=1 Tax=Borrelia miyamotoi TaxID=47466 RepID=UPI0012E0EB21|nr:hypothetical protein [Borrelia miyamotoi]QGT56759.1 hypothetical protein GNY88_03215 [Borrelia miyamotoi]
MNKIRSLPILIILIVLLITSFGGLQNKKTMIKKEFKDILKTDSLIELEKINWQEELNIDE